MNERTLENAGFLRLTRRDAYELSVLIPVEQIRVIFQQVPSGSMVRLKSGEDIQVTEGIDYFVKHALPK